MRLHLAKIICALSLLVVASSVRADVESYLDEAVTLNYSAKVGKAFAVTLAEQTKIKGLYQLVSGPSWLQMSETGILFGTPSEAVVGENRLFVSTMYQAKEYLFRVIVNVQKESTSTDFSYVAKVGEIFKIDLAVQAKLGEMKDLAKFTYSDKLPAWLEAQEKGILIGLPEKKDVGKSAFMVTVNLPEKTPITFTVTVTVRGEEVGEEGAFIAKVGKPFQLDIIEMLKVPGTYHVAEAPAFLNFNSKGHLVGVPTMADVGVHKVLVQIYSAEEDKTSYFSFHIKVEADI